MASSRQIRVEIVGDTRKLRREFLRAELLFARSPWKRLKLRIALWRLNREGAP